MTASDLVGLYVHIPFCSVKCFYCDFTAFAGQGKAVSKYLEALRAEAAKHPRRPDTIYVGGGTPSELTAEQIRELFDILPKGCREVTFEGNPESLTPEKIAVLEKAGVTRLSIGLQTHDDQLLKAIGRKHSQAEFLEVYKAARGKFSISIDLMHGLPGQSPLSFQESLGFVLGLEPQHLSIYALQVEDRTLFAKRHVEPDEDEGRFMAEAAMDWLAEAGYKHYEISNWAKPGHESLHNINYWRDGEYVGLGCGASGYIDGVRYTNSERLNDYIAGAAPETEKLTGKHKLGEALMLGLRLVDGFAPSGPMWQAFEGEIAELEKQRLLARHGAKLRLTRQGHFLANQVFREFVPPYAEAVTP